MVETKAAHHFNTDSVEILSLAEIGLLTILTSSPSAAIVCSKTTSHIKIKAKIYGATAKT